ncbi:MAG: nickel-dependent lactate racemase [Pelolinea sp.]|nr:nickel-dependent lactate racemase [Pelolinea sp.]
MKEINIPYGQTFITYEFERDNSVNLILPKENTVDSVQEADFVKKALNNCLGMIDKNLFKASECTVSIALNDLTRPMPNHFLLPLLLKKLENENISPENITFFISTGMHKKLTNVEIIDLLSPEIANKYRTIVHNCENEEKLTYLGKSTIGTPIYVNSEYYENDVKIVVGHIEPHHFMGFSGGVKSAVIGLGGRKTIESNHRLILDPHAKAGLYYSNPMRKDIEEIGKTIGIDLALNVVMNSQKKIINAFYGNPIQVMIAGIEASKLACQIDSEKTYDLIIASPGGYPKDINLYQSQKAITHACAFLKKKGVVVLVAECKDGVGNRLFEEYFLNKNNYQEVIEAFNKEEFRIGPHKAYQLALQLNDHPIFLISGMDPRIVKNMFITPVNDINEVFSLTKDLFPVNPKIAVLPYATHTMHTIREGKK